MPDGGELTVRLSKSCDAYTLTIRDTGTGIPKEDMERLYEPFFTTKKDRIGMGLVYCKEVVEAHDGALNIRSSHEGTTVTVTLPVTE